MSNLSRRQFLKTASILGVGLSGIAGTLLGSQKDPDEKKPALKPLVAVVEGDKPYEMAVAALGLLGGIKKFVKKDSVVVLKPNIAWERPLEAAANTNPDVVLAVISECFKAGAKKVKIVERSCNDPKKCFQISGFEKALIGNKAEVVLLTNDSKEYQEVPIPDGKELKSVLIAKEALNCDVFINIPIAKHHGLARLTLGIKNLMGVAGGRRSQLHQNLGPKMAEILSVIRPNLTIIDAYRVLVRNGPTGGNLKDVVLAKQIIASTDPVAADSYACAIKPFALEGKNIGCVQAAYEMGLGEIDLAKMDIIEKKI
jgi:uncharacterized protein (DUF362 family)